MTSVYLGLDPGASGAILPAKRRVRPVSSGIRPESRARTGTLPSGTSLMGDVWNVNERDPSIRRGPPRRKACLFTPICQEPP